MGKRCQTLSFGGGACSAGGTHDLSGSGDYTLRQNAGQGEWRRDPDVGRPALERRQARRRAHGRNSPEPTSTTALSRLTCVAGFVVTGNEDGANHVIAELSRAGGDVGFTVPGQAFTYWNMGPGPGPDYSDTDHGREYSASIGRAAASNLVAVARASTANPTPAPPN